MMRKLLIFGNSGSGKSTLANRLSAEEGLAHLDLDTLAWQATTPPQRQLIEESNKVLQSFVKANSAWVIEGCYTDLLECVVSEADEIIFMDLPIQACIKNAKNRPWEPHKYASKQEQDHMLEFLLSWIADYENREDTFSAKSHRQFFEAFKGAKTRYEKNLEVKQLKS